MFDLTTNSKMHIEIRVSSLLVLFFKYSNKKSSIFSKSTK